MRVSRRGTLEEEAGSDSGSEQSRRRRKFRSRTRTDERKLLNLLREGNSDALKVVMEQYHDRLFSVAMRICKNHEDTEEILQDVYWIAVSKVGGFKERSTLSTWLYRITVNAALMKVRSHRRHSCHIPFDDLSESLHAKGPFPCFDGRTRPQDALIMSKEFYERMGDSVTNLPPIYREVFILRDLYGYSIREASEMLETTHAAVKSRLHRSRSFMKKELGEYRL